MRKTAFLFIISVFLYGCMNSANEKIVPKFSSIRKNLFKRKCALYTCHSSAYYSKSGNLDLSNSGSYRNIVNIRSKKYPKLFRIKSGDTEKSVLFHRLEGTLICGPSFERERVSPEEVEAVRKWIEAGAKNN